MKKLVPFVIVWIVAVAFVRGDAQEPARPASPPPAPRAAAPPAASGQPAAPADSQQAFVNQYCVVCHNERMKTGGLVLESLDITQVGPHAETWEKVVRKIKTGLMPPAGARRPDRAGLDGFAAELERRLDRAVAPNANLSTPALHRLNRTEYANAIRDLLDLDIDVSTLLPGDGSSEGFDNLAEALSVSPSLIQGYVSAAMKISRLAVGDRTLAPLQTTFAPPPNAPPPMLKSYSASTGNVCFTSIPPRVPSGSPSMCWSWARSGGLGKVSCCAAAVRSPTARRLIFIAAGT